MIKLEKILVPVDFSECSEKAMTYATELAKRFHARELHLLHVVEPLTMAMPSPGAPLPDALLTDTETHAREELLKWPRVPLESTSISRVVRRGRPFVEIVRYAKQEDADLIVMGTHGRGGITHVLIGSDAERVVQKAPCPVLTVRAEGHQFVMP